MFSVTLPGSDTGPAPDISQLARWAPHTHVSACSRWHTPKAADAEHPGWKTWPSNPRQTVHLAMQVNALEETPGQLNPEWVEWLMGYPAGWTDCED
jgi:hypothetical protein